MGKKKRRSFPDEVKRQAAERVEMPSPLALTTGEDSNGGFGKITSGGYTAGASECVGMAKPRRLRLDQKLCRFRPVEGHRHDRERVSGPQDHGSACTHILDAVGFICVMRKLYHTSRTSLFS